MNVPAVDPPPGNDPLATETVTFEGAVPELEERLNHPPPSAVLVVAVQFNVPVPPLAISKV